MIPAQQSSDTTPAVVRLSLGASVLVLSIHLVFAGLSGLLNIWVALTPNQDREWNTSRSRA